MPNNYVLLETIALTQSATSVTFDNLPTSGYTDLKVVISGRDSSSTGVSGGGYSFTIYPNGLSTNISQRSIFGAGSGTPGSYTDTQMYNPIEMNADTANTYSNVEIYVPNYRSSNPKSFNIDGVTENNATSAASRLAAGLWNSTAAITSLQFNAYSTWMAGSTFSLYGIAAYGTTPVTAPKATGGNIVANDGTYWYHAFTSSGNFVPQVGLTADYLVVAGGGGGGGLYHGGGGGAGGLRAITAQTLTNATNYAVTVGAGGAGGSGAASANIGANGSATSFNSYAVSGGGGGGSTAGTTVPSAAGNGGSGGGSTGYSTTLYGTGNTGGYSPVEGYRGGAGINGGLYGAGGGGGASAIGSAATSSTGGAGGAGTDTYNSINFSTWLTATTLGSSSKLAGGGGGSCYSTGAYGAGGVGGGGRGSNQVSGTFDPVAGTANTGGGGGGSERSGSGSGAAGGSGIVIIRYPIA
jgi:hypothetical protein